jgi:hypothetical protein
MKIVKELSKSKVEVLEDEKIIIVTSTSNYIPEKQFKEIFNSILDLVKEKSYEKLIFDKRKMSVFHQPSMEWYYLEWKPEALKYGLRLHRKILPDNMVFNNSVQLCKKMLDEQYPDAKYHSIDLEYKNTLEHAILE